MRWRFYLLLFLSTIAHSNVFAQQAQLNNVPEAFKNIFYISEGAYQFKSKLKIPAGGHLQSVQAYTKNNKTHFIITASSGSYAYYIDATNNGEASLYKISDEPFRHAGGCQIADGKIFTGVEDNAAKDKANVVMFTPGDTLIETIIQRKGNFKRSTAGAVGAVKIKDHYLVAVGDWDSRHIDFYRSSATGFDSVGTYNAPDSSKWGSYQSINLLTDTTGQVYLIGFCREGKQDRADLFVINDYKLALVSSRYFNCRKGYSFRYGAGTAIFTNEIFGIYVCTRKLKKQNKILLFIPSNIYY